jgi:hypothetical protein
MIRFVNKNDLDEQKYNACISNSKQSLLYAYSWYLDIVCDDWKVLVWQDYQAVMPVPYRKKYGINYVHPPLWILQLGIFSTTDEVSEAEFIKVLCKSFRFVELRLNSGNQIQQNADFQKRKFQELAINITYESLHKEYQSDRRKDLRKAAKHGLQAKWGDVPNHMINLFKANVGQRTPEIKEQDYQNLERLMHTCIEKDAGEVLSIYQDEQLVASGFFLKHQKTVTILCSSTDFSNRNNGANTFLIDTAIQKYRSSHETFNFGGSSMPSIAKYFFSFGANEKIYPFLLQKRVPSLLRLLKP